MKKSPDAFRTISEVAAWLDTPAHVLRFWESRFPDLKPVQRAGGRRYYRRDDMLLIGGIKHLLHTEGHTIKSVQDRIAADGTAAIAAFSPPLGTAPVDRARDVEITLELDAVPPRGAGSSGDETAGNDAMGAQGDDTAPPIGFFFDDSDDAAPADAQSGTFAQPVMQDLREGPLPSVTGVLDAPAPVELAPSDMPAADSAAPVLEPRLGTIPELPDDPSDDAAQRITLLPLSARLRALDRDDVPEAHRDVLRGLFRRLEGWFHVAGQATLR